MVRHRISDLKKITAAFRQSYDSAVATRRFDDVRVSNNARRELQASMDVVADLERNPQVEAPFLGPIQTSLAEARNLLEGRPQIDAQNDDRRRPPSPSLVPPSIPSFHAPPTRTPPAPPSPSSTTSTIRRERAQILADARLRHMEENRRIDLQYATAEDEAEEEEARYREEERQRKKKLAAAKYAADIARTRAQNEFNLAQADADDLLDQQNAVAVDPTVLNQRLNGWLNESAADPTFPSPDSVALDARMQALLHAPVAAPSSDPPAPPSTPILTSPKIDGVTPETVLPSVVSASNRHAQERDDAALAARFQAEENAAAAAIESILKSSPPQ